LGATVHQGEVVARLDPIDAQKQVAAAQAPLDAVDVVLDATASDVATLTIGEPAHRVRLGMTGDAAVVPSVAAAHDAHTFKVPATALFHRGREPAVWVIRAPDSTLALWAVAARLNCDEMTSPEGVTRGSGDIDNLWTGIILTKEKLMFRLARISRGCARLLHKIASLLAASLLCGAIAHAQPSISVTIFDNPLSPGCQGAATPPRTTDPIKGDQYVLLLFFQSSATAAVQQLFQAQPDQNGKPQDGCWKDPGSAKSPSFLLRVQGSCPTDCVKPYIARLSQRKKTTESSQYSGDPLRDPNSPKWWGLFFADPAGGDYADDDDRTYFGVWQIVVEDSRQAGRVLDSLYNTNKALFSPRGGYLGHIMVGLTTPPAPTKN
jgi:hypothetical protein